MKLAHVIITRFSFRGRQAMGHIAGPTWYRTDDPLHPDRLRSRLRLFQIVCLPSVRAQSELDFVWIVIVDRDLSGEVRRDLESLLHQSDNARVHEYWPGDRLETSHWLERFLPEAPDLLVTTNLDDDDALPIDFARSVRAHLADLTVRGDVPPVKVIGAKEISQWDLVASPAAPLGWKCPWHRRDYPSSCGFSLMCRYPRHRLSVLGLEHVHAERYLDLGTPTEVDNVRHVQGLMFAGEGQREADLIKRLAPDQRFYDFSADTGPVLMTNHAHNDQARRLHEQKDAYEKVTGPETFSNVGLDWDALRSSTGLFTAEAPADGPPGADG